jgi:hypothetical protein
VVPGNHDCRIQGIYSRKFSRDRTFNAEASEFFAIFGDYFQNKSVIFSNLNGSPPIVVKIICLNSNDTDVLLNFATGAVSAQELQKLSLLKTLGDANDDEIRKAVQFRACMVHHHPLPVAAAESFRNPQQRGQSKLQNMVSVVMGEQTNMFKNGGSFIFHCLDNEVDIVMHGHQHYSWFSNIQYPAKNMQRLLVSGAASAGTPSDNRYCYCIYRLESTGNIKVEEHTSLHNLVRYEKTLDFAVYDYAGMRSTRRRKLIEQMSAKPDDRGCKLGIAEAEEYLHTTRIGLDGNAYIVRVYRNLRPIGDAPVKCVPIRASSSGFLGHEDPPKIAIVHDQDNYYRAIKWEVKESDSERELFGNLVFSPELHPSHPVTVRVQYTLANAFEFVKEYRCAKTYPNIDELEHSSNSLRSVFANLLNEVIIFPPELGLPGPPLLHVTGPGSSEEVDEAETAYCQDFVNAALESGVISLKIKDPLPNFNYRVSWHLFPESDYNSKIFSSSGVDKYEGIVKNTLPEQDILNSIKEILERVLDIFSAPLEGETKPWFDETTEVALLLPVKRAIPSKGIIDVMLHRVAHVFTSNDFRSSGDKSFRPGVGIGGQAFRSRSPILFNFERGQSTALYKMFPEQKVVHSVLLSIPLPVRADPEANDPVYGVICIGNSNTCARLCQLTPGSSVWYAMIDFVQGQGINGQILKLLTNH